MRPFFSTSLAVLGILALTVAAQQQRFPQVGQQQGGAQIPLQQPGNDIKSPAPRPTPNGPAIVKPLEHRLSKPVISDNLTIYLIHGKNQIKGTKFLTLQEAMAQKKVVVHETKNVNRLSIENQSKDEEVFIQAGDIVKGGQQDRVIAFDLIIPAKSGQVPLASFCVESGRWAKRGQEMSKSFSGSKDVLNSKALKLAARFQYSQRAVWRNVANEQSKLGSNIMKSVRSPQSASSLQLTLEHKEVKKAIEQHMSKLEGLLKGKDDVIGFAMAINGKVYSADVYASSELFKKLWPKLAKAAAVEAVADKKKDAKWKPVTEKAVQSFLVDAEKGKSLNQDVSKRLQQITQESKKNVLFETRDKKQRGAFLRRSYIAK